MHTRAVSQKRFADHNIWNLTFDVLVFQTTI